MHVRLVPVEGGPPIEINKDLVVVGRKEDCDIQLDHKSVSKQHCVIVKTDGLLLVRDMGSTNGTRVNGQRVRRAALLPNDQLSIASLRYKIQFTVEEDPPSPDEFTQQLNAKDVARLLKARTNDEPKDDDSEEDLALPPVKANVLPDVYPESQKK
jgi:pSer/pThr/pTyr-binding forkhead associated (FHA) protein